jgi:hypothetical protein
MNNVSEKGSDFIQDLGDAVRKNPISAAFIGMGVLWLFAGSRPVERVGDFARSSVWTAFRTRPAMLLMPLALPCDREPMR